MESRLLEMITGNLSLTGKITANMPLILYTVILTVILVYVIRFMQHRKLVIIYEKVRNGYIRTSGRYTKSKDKETGLFYLRPIFGKKRLPDFPSKYWQKTYGLPIFGCLRIINLVKLNDHTYKPIVPNIQKSVAEIINYSNIGWVYMNEYKRFVKERKRADMIYLLSILAPSIIIVATIGFFAFAMLGQAGIERTAAEKINQATEVIINYATRK